MYLATDELASVCDCVVYTDVLCKNRWNDQDAVGGGEALTRGGSRNHVLDWGSRLDESI